MSVNKEVGLQPRDYSRCQIAHLPANSPSSESSSCAEAAKEEVDGLLLCERHALEAKLEGQIECWEEMLFHIELWSSTQTSRGWGFFLIESMVDDVRLSGDPDHRTIELVMRLE